MKKQYKVSLITAFFAVVTFVLGPIIWPAGTFEGGPSGIQLPLLIVISILEAIAFGLGVSFLLYGWEWVRCVAQGSKKTAWALYITITWLLVSWWPHDNMHISNAPDDWWRLILIEYLFHVTLIASAITLAWCFFHVLKRCQVELKS